MRGIKAPALAWALIAGLPAGCGDIFDANPAPATTYCDTDYGPMHCSPRTCGNGFRNACFEAPATGFGYCGGMTIYEPCDGSDLGGSSCEVMGYANGTLRCAPNCDGFDASGCGACMPSPSVVHCGPPIPTTPLFPIAADLAATDGEVALTWVEPTAGPDTGIPALLRVARFTPELDRITDVSLDEPAIDTARVTDAPGVFLAIAPLPSAGWVVAGRTQSGTFLHAIDGAGRDAGSIAVEGPSPFQTNYAVAIGVVNKDPPRLASRPGGAPLMVWAAGEGAYRAAVVSDDGRSMTAPVDITVPTGGYSEMTSATFAGDTFYVVFWFDKGIQVARISPAGDLLGVDTELDDIQVFEPFFIDGANPPRIIYQAWTTDSTPPDLAPPTGIATVMIAQDLGTGGAAPAPPNYIRAGMTGLAAPSSGVAFGTDMVLAAGGWDENVQALGVARADAGGTFLATPIEVTRGLEINWSRIVRRGPDAVIAWFGFPAPMHIARVQP
jgi:hypothetical protein